MVYCPFTFGQDASADRECIERHCAWWVRPDFGCAITKLAHNSSNIANDLQNLAQSLAELNEIASRAND